MERLQHTLQHYAWGSPTAIPALLGLKPDGRPHAELWLGAHLSSPSILSTGETLPGYIAAAPAQRLGAHHFEHFGPRLPFLLKVLAAAQPLSLQAHPDEEQARVGFAREEALGIPLHAPHRNYKDAHHKPEIICALSPFQALCGFRPLHQTLALFSALQIPTTTLETLGLRLYFEHLLHAPALEKSQLIQQLVTGASRHPSPFEAECALAIRLHALYPNDIGVVVALLLNFITLQPGEALYLGAGELHAYIEGLGVELMANSDNVLRGGLTPKHVDVDELLSVLTFSENTPHILRPDSTGVYATPAPDFCLSRIAVHGRPVELSLRGAQIVLATQGAPLVSTREQSISLARGEALFIAADEGVVTVSGEGEVFRATGGLGAP